MKVAVAPFNVGAFCCAVLTTALSAVAAAKQLEVASFALGFAAAHHAFKVFP